jgi:hypothetical protein
MRSRPSRQEFAEPAPLARAGLDARAFAAVAAVAGRNHPGRALCFAPPSLRTPDASRRAW